MPVGVGHVGHGVAGASRAKHRSPVIMGQKGTLDFRQQAPSPKRKHVAGANGQLSKAQRLEIEHCIGRFGLELAGRGFNRNSSQSL